ncbi:hypothetical protein DLAC_00017 [Tieghemostelium lacteum]|uniref:Transmembrane protein n=1 Tax=Tieghemostelium lacteum TaxID=361077 RepID=A0A152A929_TIELA|nr:hypothetical protein DLAC_00017 [Tieghemostelium lacteum]|eukprot:KYR02577.1 hypothetical protein DLAC_00017 [Tieghemostelium lacteum]
MTIIDRKKIIVSLFIIFTLLGIASCIVIVFIDLLPSFQEGKLYQQTNCYLIKETINSTWISSTLTPSTTKCLDLNNDRVWWYDSMGEESFFKSVVYKEKDKLAGLDSSEMSDDTSSTDDQKTKCYIGIFTVEYEANRTSYIGDITGIWYNSDLFTRNYLNLYQNGTTYPCYYLKSNFTLINWFAPPTYSVQALVILILCIVYSILTASGFLYFYKKFYPNSRKNGYLPIQ